MKLYEITGRLAAIDQAIDDADGELAPELEAELDALNYCLDEKAERIACLIREKKATADAAHEEAARLLKIRQAAERSAENLKSYLLRELEAAGRDRAGSKLAGVRVQASPPSVRCHAPTDAIPERYRLVTTQVRFNAQLALNDFKAGDTLPPEVEIVQGKHLRLI